MPPALTIKMSPYTLMLVETGVAVMLALIMLASYYALKSRRPPRGGEAAEMYIGGEHPSILSRPSAPPAGLYWGFVALFARKLYYYVRVVMHSGVLNDWAKYMSSWLGFLALVALLAVAVATAAQHLVG